MFRMSRCNGMDGLYSTAMEVHVLVGKRSLRKMIDGDARLFHFRSSARVRPQCFQCIDHLSSSATKLCSDARFMTASHAKSVSAIRIFHVFIVEEVELRKASFLSKFFIAALGCRKEVGKRELIGKEFLRNASSASSSFFFETRETRILHAMTI